MNFRYQSPFETKKKGIKFEHNYPNNFMPYNMKIKDYSWPFLLMICTAFLKCSKSGPQQNQPSPSQGLSITSINPTHGAYSSIVLVNGLNFNSDPSKDSVFINGHYATINSASTTQLSINVPTLAGTGNVLVETGGIRTSGPVFSYDTTLIISTLAGNGTIGSTDGPGSSASFNDLHGIAVDTNGNVFVSDFLNYTIRKITPDGIVSTFAGSPGIAGSADGVSSTARFGGPSGLAADKYGNIYVADLFSQKIRKITPNGTVSTLAGSDSAVHFVINGPANIATFGNPEGVAVDDSGNVFVADENDYMVRKISYNGIVSTIAGTGALGEINGPADSATFWDPKDVAVDSYGNIYEADGIGHTIRKISNGIVSTLAGQSMPGDVDGTGTAALFWGIESIFVDKNNNIFVTDFDNNKIRKISLDGKVTTYAGGGAGDLDGPVPYSTFRGPYGIAFDKFGVGYFTDLFNQKVKKIEFK